MADKRSKKIKFALYLKNNEEVRTKRDLKKYFDMAEIIGYLFDGKLLQWMRDHDYPTASCLAVKEVLKDYNKKKIAVRNLSIGDEKNFTREVIIKLCKIFEIDESEIEEIESIEQIRKSSNNEYEIIQAAAFEDEDEEENTLEYINQIVRTQEELNEVINRLKAQKKSGKYKIIYLLNQDEPYRLLKEDVFYTTLRFVGINRQSIEDETKIISEQTVDEGKTEILEEEQINIFRTKPENRDKFSNLKIIAQKRTGIDSYDEVEIDCPKIKMSSESGGKDDTGIEVATEKLMLYLDAGLPIIYIDTFEEDKADEIINSVAVERDIYEWNKAEGLFKRNNYNEHIANFDNRMPLKETLQNFIDDVRSLQYGATIKCQLKNSVLVLKDVHKYFDDEDIVAQLKYLAQLIYSGKLEDCTIIIVSSVLKIPTVLEHYLTILKIDNLNENEIEELIINFCEKHDAKKPSDILLKKLLTAFKGMSEFDIINILSLALAGENDITFSDLDLIIENKKQIIRKTNILEMVECDEKEDDIGGLEHLKAWLKKKENTFRHIDEAMRCGVRIPKGILIVGMPGCGKTLTAKATAAIFDLPLLKLDMGKILGKYVGESEKNMHRATELAEVTAPCVLWIDELEKAFAGTGGDGGGEITVRLLGLFLTWMQEKTSPVFVVATANSVDRLPPELLRKGRFDEIFYVGTPNASERKDIFNIHIDKVRYNDNFEWSSSEGDAEEKIEKLVKSTLGCSGADIAGFVADAVERSFSKFMEEKKYSTTKSQTVGEEKKKPVFNPDIIQNVIDGAGQVSAWNQLKRMFGNYKRKRFKNASQPDFRDVVYWVNLRLAYLAKSPQRIFGVMKIVSNGTRDFIHKRGLEKIRRWDNEELKIKTDNLPKLSRHVKFYRKIARKFFGLFEREDNKKSKLAKVSLIKKSKPKS